jgi:hypothetical protein
MARPSPSAAAAASSRSTASTTAALVKQLDGHTKTVFGLAYTPDGKAPALRL